MACQLPRIDAAAAEFGGHGVAQQLRSPGLRQLQRLAHGVPGGADGGNAGLDDGFIAGFRVHDGLFPAHEPVLRGAEPLFQKVVHDDDRPVLLGLDAADGIEGEAAVLAQPLAALGPHAHVHDGVGPGEGADGRDQVAPYWQQAGGMARIGARAGLGVVQHLRHLGDRDAVGAAARLLLFRR